MNMMNKNQIVKISFMVFSLFIFCLLYITSPSHNASFYYKIIRSQEDPKDIFIIPESEKEEIFNCKSSKTMSNDDCLRAFYFNYTIKNGPEKAFAHLARLQLDFPEMLPGCHYISHGIGHANLQVYKGNPEKAFEVMQKSGYFKNIATCGNGYYHGVIEEFSKGVKSVDEMIVRLKSVCGNATIKKTGNCFHGVGHAAVVELLNLKEALWVCDGLTEDKVDLFSCHTGVFMEAAGTIEPDYVSVKNGVMIYNLCDSVDKKYRPACYMEQSSGEAYSNNRDNYTRNIGFCKHIKDDLNRMSCIKLNAIRSVRISRYDKIYEMCANTTTKYEQVMCTAVVAQRIGGSIDVTMKNPLAIKAAKDICRTLDIYGQIQCMNIGFAERKRLFYVSEDDLKFKPLTLKMIKRLFDSFPQ
jgi:hypothetical protein